MNIKNILILFLSIVLLSGCDLFTHLSKNSYLNEYSSNSDPIQFYTTHIVSSDLKVHYVTVERIADDIRFSVEYESEFVRGWSFFNPPSGAIFMYFNLTSGIYIGRNIFTIDVPVSEIIQTPDITMRFLDGADTLDYIYFITNAFANLLNEPAVAPYQAEITIIRFANHSKDEYWGRYFTFNAVDGSGYYVWYHNGGGSGNPGPIGTRTGISVSAPGLLSTADLITNTVNAINSAAGTKVTAVDTSSGFDYKLNLTQDVVGPCINAAGGTLGVNLPEILVTVSIIQQGR